MRNFFKRIKIRVKLLLAFGSIILLSVLLTVYAIHSISRIIELEALNKESQKLSISLERIELATKEFIFEGYKEKEFQEFGRSVVIAFFDSALSSANNSLKVIAVTPFISDKETKTIVSSLVTSTVIRDGFYETTNLLKKRGFKDFGLEGSLRNAIHKIEASTYTYDRALMLTLRRHEKDFFLRKDLKYRDEFNASAESFRAALQSVGNAELVTLLMDYQNEFNQVVEIEKEIGLTMNSGKKGELFSELEQARLAIEMVQHTVHTTTRQQISRSKLLLLIIFLIQLTTAIVLALTYSHVLTSVIKEIRFTMTRLADGVFPPPLTVKSTEEIGQTKTAINQFLDRLKAATSFAETLGNGHLNTRYDIRFNNDVIASALITMQQKLLEAEAIQAKINWTNKGAARFNEILKTDSTDIRVLGDKILKLLVDYLEVNQAALFIIRHGEQCLERIATYAYGKKKFAESKIDLHEGLAGQCFTERETIYLKEIPRDYVKITSGLGEATPRNVLIVPLKTRDQVNGVLEIASFKLLEEHEVRFIETTAENIAAILSSHEMANQTKKLLEDSQQRARELAQQEEEMRQNAEELQATQEEMDRQRAELQHEIMVLKEKLKQTKQHNISVLQ